MITLETSQKKIPPSILFVNGILIPCNSINKELSGVRTVNKKPLPRNTHEHYVEINSIASKFQKQPKALSPKPHQLSKLEAVTRSKSLCGTSPPQEVLPTTCGSRFRVQSLYEAQAQGLGLSR